MSEPQPQTDNKQRITTYLDFVVNKENFAVVGFAVEDLLRERWKFCRITMNENGEFVIWLARTWEAVVKEQEKSA